MVVVVGLEEVDEGQKQNISDNDSTFLNNEGICRFKDESNHPNSNLI